MKLGTKGRYAVMAMVDLALQEGEGPTALADIAERQRISLSYLEQLFAKLRRAGIVRSHRGPGGGYVLARQAKETAVADIILAVDEPVRTTMCKEGDLLGCRGQASRCLTHDLWEELGDHIRAFLESVTLADVTARRRCGKISGADEDFRDPAGILQ